MKHVLDFKDLQKTPTKNLERLIKFLNLTVIRNEIESDNLYRHKLIRIIQRCEKQYKIGKLK